MKRILTLAIIALAGNFTQAQMLTPQVIASSGGFSTNSSGSLSYTVAEMTAVSTLTANGNILTQGFQQPTDKTVGLIDMTHDAYGSFVVYPNPAVDQLHFGFQFPDAGKVKVTMYNDLGQLIQEVYEANYDNGKVVKPVDVSMLAAGLYFLNATMTLENGEVRIVTKKFQVIN